jgi:DNA-binding transcriptional MerR regulator
MRALARALGVSPSTIHRWRTQGLTPKGRELLHEAGLRPKAKRPSKKAAGPVQAASVQVAAFVVALEKKSEASKKGWAKRRRKERYQAVLHEWTALDLFHPRTTPPKRFVEVAKGLGLSVEEAKGFWEAGVKGTLSDFVGVSQQDLSAWKNTDLKPKAAQALDDIRTDVETKCKTLYDEWIDIHADIGIQEDPKNPDRIQLLRVHIQNDTAEFKRFMKAATGLQFSTREAKDFWFSPSALC